MPYLLDACALIAYARDEDGSEVVEQLLSQEVCFVHALNVYELYKDDLERGGDLSAIDDLFTDLGDAIVKLDMISDGVARQAAQIKFDFRCAIPDAIGVAAASESNLTFVTADHGELEPILEAGFPILFFR